MFDYDTYKNEVKQRATALIQADLTDEDKDLDWDIIENFSVDMTVQAAKEKCPDLSDNHDALSVLVSKPDLLDSREGSGGGTVRKHISEVLVHEVCEDLRPTITEETKVLFEAVGGCVSRPPSFR